MRKFLNAISKVIFLLLIVQQAPTVCFSQSKQIDSLKAVTPLNDTAKVDLLNSLSKEFTFINKEDSAVSLADKAYKEAVRLEYINGIALSLTLKAQIAKHFHDDFQQTEKIAREALRWYDKTNDKKGIDILYDQLWMVLFAQSRYKESSLFAQKKYELGKAAGNRLWMISGLSAMGVVYKESGDYEKSFYYNRKVYDLETKSLLALPLFSLGELYLIIEDYPSALTYFRKAFSLDNAEAQAERLRSGWDIWLKMEFAEIFSHLKQFDSAWHYYHLFKPAKDKEQYKRVYLVSTGECFLLQKRYAEALQNFRVALPMHRKLNDRNQVMRTVLNMAKTLIALEHHQSALPYAMEGLTMASAANAKQFRRDACKMLSLIYERLGKADSALIYHKWYTSAKDSVTSEQTKTKFSVYDYEQQIRFLNTENKAQAEKLTIEAFQKKVILISLFSLIILLNVIYRNVLLKRKHEKLVLENQINLEHLNNDRQQAELQKKSLDLEMQALRAQMNPHFIFNSLSSINSFILTSNKKKASSYLTKFSKLIRLILQNSKASFIPLENELQALQLYLELESIRFDHKFYYKINIAEEIEASIIKVPPLVIQPYVENSIWHGLMPKEGKGHLEIDVYLQNEVLHCKITDDGIGREKANALKSKEPITYKSFGMGITASRIALLQPTEGIGSFISVNDLTLPDGTAGGTEVILQIPVHYD